MTTRKPRLYLFCGSDSQASLAACATWVRLFQKKYGTLSLFAFEADEMAFDDLSAQLAKSLETQTLFASPKLIVVKRASHLDKGTGTKSAQHLMEILKARAAFLDEEITVVFWEDKRLAETHPIIRAMQEWSLSGVAEVRMFQLPQGDIRKLSQSYLRKQGYEIEEDAVRWLQNQYVQIEKEARLLQRLKGGEELKSDTRGWWLYGLLDGAILRSATHTVRLADIRAGTEEIQAPVSVFMVTQAIARLDWGSARGLARQLEQADSDDGTYFTLYAALRWQVANKPFVGGTRMRTYALKLLGEIELVSKNTTIPHAWLLDLFLLRLKHGQEGEDFSEIFSPRLLWLAQLPRS
jgi:hypothetical protein